MHLASLLAVALVTAQTPTPPTSAPTPVRGPRWSPVVEVVKSAGPAVVNIGAEVVTRSNPFGGGRAGRDPYWGSFGGRPQKTQRSQSLGSGVIIDAAGLVLTNEHVISRATNITVTLADRRTFSAEVVGADPRFDVAVLKIIDGKDLPVVKVGVSEDLMPGETVVAIGNPFGLSNTVTTGVVSALHRSIEAEGRSYEDFVQTDAAINPGNSGGALLNVEGALIGINTAIYSSGNGIGFAIPIDRATAVVQEVLRYGEVRPAFTGILINPESSPGAVVSGLIPNSPAEQSGLRKGDVIVDIGGQEVKSGQAFWQTERGLIPGRTVAIRYRRAGKAQTMQLPVHELDRDLAVRIGKARLGIDVVQRRGRLQIKMVGKTSAAAEIGVRKGDLLLALGGRRIRTIAEFEAICAVAYDMHSVLAHIGRRGRQTTPVNLRLSIDTLPGVE